MALGLPDFFGQNRIMPGQGNAIYQQMLQQYQQNQSGQIATTDLEYLNKLTETANNIDTKINRAESKDGYSGNWYDNDSMANRGGNRGGNRSREPWEPNRRSNANRSMDDRSMDYSRGEDMREEFMERVEMLRNKAPDERTRMKFDKFLNDLR